MGEGIWVVCQGSRIAESVFFEKLCHLKFYRSIFINPLRYCLLVDEVRRIGARAYYMNFARPDIAGTR